VRYWDGCAWTARADRPSPPPAAAAVAVASPWARLAARAVDAGICAALVVGVFAAARVTIPESAPPFAGLEFIFAGTFAVVVLSVVHEVTGVALWGQTVGRRLVGIRVVRAGDPSRPPGWGASLVRWAAPNLLVLVPVLGAAAFVSVWAYSCVRIFTDARRVTFHDRHAATLVVAAPSRPSRSRSLG
jgi:uncharacterized RDD family membrane protein YckC